MAFSLVLVLPVSLGFFFRKLNENYEIQFTKLSFLFDAIIGLVLTNLETTNKKQKKTTTNYLF